MLTEIEHKGDDGYLHHYESDDIEFWWYVKDGQLSYQIEGTDWQDFIVEDKRAYDDTDYNIMLSLLRSDSTSW